MVLDQDFPEPEARGQLITLMKSDVRKAMSILSDSEIQIRDIVAGSVVIYFCFVSGSSTFLEEKYLKAGRRQDVAALPRQNHLPH